MADDLTPAIFCALHTDELRFNLEAAATRPTHKRHAMTQICDMADEAR